MHAALTISCLAIGISGTLLILLYLRFELTYDTQNFNAERIYLITTNAIKTHEKTIDVAWKNTPAPLGPTLANEIPGVEGYTRLFQFWSSSSIKLQEGENVFDEKNVYAADPSVFTVFSFDFVEGDAETALIGPDKIVISESLAKRLFGDENAIGKIINSKLTSSGLPLLITGVFRDLPKNVHLFVDALVSSETDRSLQTYYYNLFNVYTYVLLHPDTDANSLATKLTGIYTKHLDPAIEPVLVSATHKLNPLRTIHLDANGGMTYVYIFSLGGILLLFISGISYVNLATARISSRSLEVGIRKILGSQRKQIIIQLIGESLAFTTISALLSIAIVVIFLPPVNETLNLNLQIAGLVDFRLVIGALILIVSLGVFGGAYPAFSIASVEPIKAIKGKVSTRATLRKVLVTIQFTVAILVVVCTGVIYDQLEYLSNKDLGFNKSQVMNITLSDEADVSRYHTFKKTLAQNNTILSIASSNFLPGKDDMGRRPVAVDGSPNQEQMFAYAGRFDHDFLSTMDIELQSGRNFLPDLPGDTAAMIVNETLVRAFELNQPLGEKVRFGGKGNPRFYTIIGVVKDFHQSSLYSPIQPQVFVLKTGGNLLLKLSANDMRSTMDFIEKSWSKTFPGSPFSYSFLDDELQDGYKSERIRGKVFFLLSLLTIVTAVISLFGLASYFAAQRTKEIGIRKVLGATLWDTVFLITSDFIVLVLIAAVPAFVIAWFVADQWLGNFAFRVRLDYEIFALSLVFTLLLTLLTTGFHAWRAASVNPVRSLRAE